jgi:hypothetical protein
MTLVFLECVWDNILYIAARGDDCIGSSSSTSFESRFFQYTLLLESAYERYEKDRADGWDGETRRRLITHHVSSFGTTWPTAGSDRDDDTQSSGWWGSRVSLLSG